MANASVDKLKALGLRHGEKAVVGITAALFVAFAVMAIIRPTIDIKPEQLRSTAEAAEANLRKQQDPKDILARLEEAGLKSPNFEKTVESQQANALKPADYRVKLDWVTPEPGAGLIRDQPELVAPTELAAFPGRGGVFMYALDAKGERIVDSGDAEGKTKKGGRKAPRSPMMMPGMGGPGMGPPPDNSEEGKKKAAIQADRLKKSLAGTVEPGKEKDQPKAEEAAPPEPQGPWKEETKGRRWVVITGVVDNEQMKKNWLLALKNPAVAYPNYKRVDVERQVMNDEGAWSDWAAPDQNKNFEVLDNIPEQDQEYVPESQRPSALVDPLPFLRAGYWTGVHVARLVPADIRDATKPGPEGGMGPGMGGPGRGGPGMGGPGKLSGMSMGPGSKMMGPGMGGPGGDSPISPEESNFTKIEDPTVMLRSLDFTVDPDKTYRYRVRLVVVNPNKDHTDVNPGVDIESKELLGPWSEPTGPVTLPADVAVYAQAPVQTERRRDQVSFQVIKWDPNTGQTVLKNDEAGPGEIVGEYGSVLMPASDGTGTKNPSIDFNSRSIVLDTMGGRVRLPDIGLERNPFEIPALAMVVQADGSVAIKNQAVDKADEVREDMETNYRQALEDSTKDRKPGGGSRMPGAGKKMGRGKKI